MLDAKLLEILVCPKCKTKVEKTEAAAGEDVQCWLACAACGLRYPVRNDIPIMLIDEATPMGGRSAS